MQLAVTLQERVASEARRLLPLEEGHDLSLPADRRLQHLRLCLAEFSLDMLEEHCEEEMCQALARAKITPAEVALQEFTRSTPEPNSTEQVLTSAACPVSDEMAKSRPPQTPVSDTRSKKKKVKNLTPAEDKAAVLDQTFPSTVKDWTQYVCPDPVRQAFRTSNSISKQTQSLFYLTLLEEELLALSLHHLTLPVLHLAETIAHDILERRSLSDIYRLKIVRTCLQLGLDSSSPYKEKLLDLSRIQEEEQMLVNSAGGHLFMSYRHFRAQLLLSETRSSLYKGLNLEFGDTVTASRSLLGLAALACEEQNHQLALNLLDEAQSHGVLFNLCPPFRIINQMDMCIVDRPDGLDPPRRIINGVLLSVQMSMIPHVIG
uniref:Tetratricopeptide repeat domain 40 n=1 Tax=Nothobranchius kuhntae TaxID=321403 RepID=A0A1A8JMZ5_NOTKU